MEFKPLNSHVRLDITISVAMGLGITAGYVLQGICVAFALTEIFGAGDIRTAVEWLGAALAAAVMRSVLVWAANVATQTTTQNVRSQLREQLLHKLLELGPGFTAKRKTGDLQNTVVNGVEMLEVYYSGYIPAVLIALIGCPAVVICLAIFDLHLAILLAFFVALLPIADRLWLRWRMPKSSGVFAAMGEFGTYLLDSLQGVATLKAFAASDLRRKNLAQRAADLRRQAMATLSITMARSGLTGLISLGGTAIVIAIATWRFMHGDLPPLALIVTLLLAREAFRPLDRVEKSLHAAWAAGGAIAPIMNLLEEEAAVQEPSAPALLPSRTDISFERVSFAYSGSNTPSLDSVSFSIPEKNFVALVGPSGSGKSTVVALLTRFFDPQLGRIKIGGIDIRNLSSTGLRSLISVVPQDTFIFHGTIEDNLKIAKPNATTDEIRRAAKAAHIDDFINSLPERYATKIGERGTGLSGGQRQRLAIARAILKDTPILLLDEATSNVDPVSEAAIQQALIEQAQKRTLLVIAHRMSTICGADSILVLADGVIQQAGRHEELVHSSAFYSKLVENQEELA